MGFFEALDKVRTKPEHVRKTYALSLAIVVTILICGGWLFYSISESSTSVSSGIASIDTKPWQSFKDNISSFFLDMKDKMGQASSLWNEIKQDSNFSSTTISSTTTDIGS